MPGKAKETKRRGRRERDNRSFLVNAVQWEQTNNYDKKTEDFLQASNFVTQNLTSVIPEETEK